MEQKDTNPQDTSEARLLSGSDMLDVTLSIELDLVEDGIADLVIHDKGFYCSTTITTRKAQELANTLQKWVDAECKGKSPELHDCELAAKRVAVDQWNACQKAIKAAETLKQQAENNFI
jgi:hypothetical protein